MRKISLVMAIAGLVVGVMAGPALASTQAHHRFRGAAVVALWRSKASQSPTRFTVTTWFVGAFPTARGAASEVAKEVDKCQVVSGHNHCTLAFFAVGLRRSLPATAFTFDRKHLQTAHLDATYQLRILKPGPPGKTFKVTIVVNWAGTGKISHSGGVSSFHSGCLHFHDTFRGRQRSATATGSENGTSLGTTKRAILSTSTDVVVEHRC
jgi:hypothetical protein